MPKNRSIFRQKINQHWTYVGKKLNNNFPNFKFDIQHSSLSIPLKQSINVEHMCVKTIIYEIKFDIQHGSFNNATLWKGSSKPDGLTFFLYWKKKSDTHANIPDKVCI